MVNKSISFVKEFARLYTGKHITRSSAALSYYLTMTIFPLIICLYTMLGNSYSKAMTVLSFAEKFMAAETARSIEDFLLYVASNNSNAMMVAGLTVLVTSASAACRSLQATIGDMQGGQRFQGLFGFLFSIVFSLLFLAALYFAVLVMLTGHTVIDKTNELLPFIDVSNSWNWLRFIVLFGIFFVIIWGVYEISKRSSGRLGRGLRRVLNFYKRVGQVSACVRLACVRYFADVLALHLLPDDLLRRGV